MRTLLPPLRYAYLPIERQSHPLHPAPNLEGLLQGPPNQAVWLQTAQGV